MQETSSGRRERYDVAVIGAGPAGTLTAIAQARRGASVLLCEANPAAATRFAGEWLHPPGRSVLESLGLLPIEAAAAHGSGRGMVVFPDNGDDPIRLPYPDGALGLSCDHQELVDTLRERAGALPNVDYRPHVRVVDLAPGRLVLRNRVKEIFTVSADLIVGAEGRNSISRSHLELTNATTPLSHMAGVELRDVELPFEGYGHVILGGPGPILLYRIGPNRARACLDLPIDRCPRRRDAALLWRTFRGALPPDLVPAFREALLADRVMWTTTRFRPRTHYGRGDIALVGDAAGFFHPLTAAGMTLAFHDATLLAESRDVDEYRRQRERQGYVAELLSMALYHVMSREDASTETIRGAMYRMWGESELERTRTMRMLISDDFRSASFAAAFLKVAVGAVKHLVLSSPDGEGHRFFPTLAQSLSVPQRLLQWPAALVFGSVSRTLFQSGRPRRPLIPQLRLVTATAEDSGDEATSRPDEIEVRVALASAFGALVDSLEAVPSNEASPGDVIATDDIPRVIQTLSNARAHLQEGPEISATLNARRRQLHRYLPGLESRTRRDPARWLSEASMALLTDSLDTDSTLALCTIIDGILLRQQPSGGFAPSHGIRSRRWFGWLGDGPQPGVSTTALCCRALAHVRRRYPTLLIERVPLALARARTWLTERQSTAGSWDRSDGRASVVLTATASEALSASGTPSTTRVLRRAGQWLCERQAETGVWCETSLPTSALTAHVVHALVSVRPTAVEAIERGANALLKPVDWNAVTSPPTRDLCAIADGLTAYLDWEREVPSALHRGRTASKASPKRAAIMPGNSLEA